MSLFLVTAAQAQGPFADITQLESNSVVKFDTVAKTTVAFNGTLSGPLPLLSGPNKIAVTPDGLEMFISTFGAFGSAASLNVAPGGH